MAKDYTVEQCHQALQRNGHKIEFPKPNAQHQIIGITTMGNVGLKCLGYIDYLCNHKHHFLNKNAKPSRYIHKR